MKLLRYGPKGQEKPGLLDKDGQIRDLSGVVKDIDGKVLADLSAIRAAKVESLPVVASGVRIAEPVAKVGKFLCIGLNYADHAKESNMPEPAEPIIFMKATSAIMGPNDDVVIPRGSQKTDWEVELGVVIGKPAKYVSEAQALDHVAGYCVVNDVSERAFQMEHAGTTTKGKSADTFGPTGPWMVTADEVGDPQKLALWTTVNGERRQDGNTAKMIFPVAALIAYVSRFMSLRAGDVISTGTPAGVGHGAKPPKYLVPGDVVEMGITSLGTQRHKIVEAR
jgi:ureidoglycolate lyase